MTNTDAAAVDEAEARRHGNRLVNDLVKTRALRSAPWIEAFRAVPRHLFVPTYHPPTTSGFGPTPVTAENPEWLASVYANTSLVTQRTEHGVPLSSSTEPALMARMLEALEISDGMNVLEIGTGTGYNAALLSHRLGDDHVTTVDVEENITGPARDRLAALGLHPAVVTADGADGHLDRAPFHRTIATCAVRALPAAWLRQTAPGGRILATLVTGLHGYALAALTVHEDGTGTGRILDEPASFMPMRAHTDPAFAALRTAAAPQTGAGTSALLPSQITTNDARFMLGLSLPDVVAFTMREDHTPGLYLAHHTDGSWAYARETGDVTYGGPQRLWHIAESAAGAWEKAGRPTPSALVLDVTPGRQTLRLPGHSWRLPHPGETGSAAKPHV